MRGGERFVEKAFGGFCVTGGTEQAFESLPLRIYRSVQINPDPFDFHICLIHAPGVGRCLEVRSAPLLQFGGIPLYPTVHRGMIDAQAPLPHHFLQITIAERIA